MGNSLWSRLQPAAMPVLVSILCAFAMVESMELFPARFCDFRAFYCAGRVVFDRQDPYREHPIHECEHNLPETFLSPLPAEITTPAPLPGYALLAFAFVSRLPFNVAVIAWTLASFAALAFSVRLISGLTSTRKSATAIVLGLPAFIVVLPIGQPTLFVLLATCACAMSLQRGRPRTAALCFLAAMLEPHAALPVGIALFLAVPATRLPLVGGACVLALLSVFTVGIGQNIEYFHEVLPQQALVNVPEFSQFSAANFAFMAGIAREPALAFGNAWYVVAVAIGVAAGIRLRARYGDCAIVLVPVAFAVFGGSYTHLQQLMFGLPAFLLILAPSIGARRMRLAMLTFVAAVPWLISCASPPQFIAIPILAIAYARLIGAPRIARQLSIGSFVVLVAICVVVANAHDPYVPFAPVGGNPLIQVAWGRYVETTSVPTRLWYILGKIPTVVAYGALLAVLIETAFGNARLVLRRERTPAVTTGYAS